MKHLHARRLAARDRLKAQIEPVKQQLKTLAAAAAKGDLKPDDKAANGRKRQELQARISRQELELSTLDQRVRDHAGPRRSLRRQALRGAARPAPADEAEAI